MHKVIFSSIVVSLLLFSSCTKDLPKEMQNKNQQMPNDSVHNKVQKSLDDTSSGELSEKKTQEMTKAADDADAKYVQTKSEEDKKECIAKQFAAANYLMFEANLSPKKKYPPALKRYRRVLELDPTHRIARISIKQIEDIYTSRGMPIPK